MPVFKVTFSGQPLTISLDGKETICGFVKNEYVFAQNEARAISKAKKKINLQMKSRGAVFGQGFELSIDSVQPGFRMLSIFSNESFIFFDV